MLALWYLPFLGYGQNGSPADEFKVVMGPLHEFPKKCEDLGYLGNMKEGILQISLDRKANILIQRFSTDKLAPTGLVRIDISEMPDRFVPDQFTWFGGNLYMFYSTWDKDAGKEHLFADRISLGDGKFANQPIGLIEADKIAGTLAATGFYKFATANKYRFDFSVDSSKMLVSYRKYTDIKDDAKSKDVLGFFVFDQDLKLIWGDEFRMPYTEKIMDNDDFAVDSKGTAYLLSKVYEGKRAEKAGDEPNYHYEILKFGQGFTELKQIKIRLDDKFINDIYLAENMQGEMICGGFYRTVFKSVSKGIIHGLNVDGAFLVKIDQNDSLYKLQKGYYEFPSEILSEFEKRSTANAVERKDKKDEAEVPSVYLRNFLVADDGSYVFVGEEYLIEERTMPSSDGSSTKYFKYVFGDIYAMKIGVNGEMAWAKKIPKSQEGKLGLGSMSYKLFYCKGDYYFFYIDNIKNLNLAPDKVPYRYLDQAAGLLMVSKIDEKGEVTKGKLSAVKAGDMMIKPAELDWFSDSVILGRTFNKSSSKLVKIECMK